MLKSLQKRLSIDSKALAVILLGSFVWSLTMVKSGINYGYGMGFWGPNGHDGIWHIALSESLSRGSVEMPIMAGEKIQNYHIGFDLLLAAIHKLSSIQLTTLYFQILPPLMALSIGVLIYKFILSWQKSQNSALWALFFTYFGGNAGWIITMARNTGLGGESLFWAQQAALTLVNPPFAMSLVILVLGLLFLVKTKNVLIPTLCFGSLIAIKAYAGVLVLVGLFLAGVYEYLKYRKTYYMKIFLGSSVLSLILFLPFNKGSSGLLVWQPGWFLETMLGFSDRLGWPRFYEALINYKLGNSTKLIPAYLLAFAIFIIGNFWTRIIGIFAIGKIEPLNILIGSMTLGAIIAPMLFLQAGTPWNTIQFLYYALFLSGLYAGAAMARIGKKKVLAFIIIVFLTIPTTAATLKHYLPSRPPAKLSNSEIEALSYLKNLPQGVVLTYPFDKDKARLAENNPPRPLYLYESSSYVAAYSGKPTFLEDGVNLNIMGYNWQERLLKVEEFYESPDLNLVRNFLRENNIKYVYWLADQRATLSETQLGIEQIFDNNEVRIYEVKQSPF